MVMLAGAQVMGVSENAAQSPTMEQTLQQQRAADLASDAREKGDASLGAIVFHAASTGCAGCHDPSSLRSPSRDLLASATMVGPDLAIWKRTVDDTHLVNSVLKPSEHIEPDYRSLQVLTADGQMISGVAKGRDADQLTLQVGARAEDVVNIAIDDIEFEKASSVSLMPAGQVNGLREPQDFLNLIAYLIAIRDGGPDAAKALRPSEESMKLRIPPYESELDHRAFIEDWGDESLWRGERIYASLCVNCHGTIETAGSLPTSLRFAQGKFKSGNDPLSIYQTLTHGAGLMLPQAWMVPQQKYDVIHYLREHFLRDRNPTQYWGITEEYLAGLPQGESRGPEPSLVQPFAIMDYGSMMTTTIEFGDDGSNIAQKAITVQLDDAAGGVVKGAAWMAFEHDTLRMAGAWSGDFVNWDGIQFNGKHGVHLHATGEIHAATLTSPGWANPANGSFVDSSRVMGRDGRRYGPLPETWGKFRGVYRHGKQVILRYTVGMTEILERPCWLADGIHPVYGRTLNVGPRETDLQMVVMTVPKDATIVPGDDAYALVTSEGKTWTVAGLGTGFGRIN